MTPREAAAWRKGYEAALRRVYRAVGAGRGLQYAYLWSYRDWRAAMLPRRWPGAKKGGKR